MRIAIVTPGGVDRSGTHRVIPCLLWLIERLVRAGNDVEVFALSQEPEAGRWSLLGATVHNAGRRPRRARLLRMLMARHRQRPFDVLHAFWAGTAGLVGAGARVLGGPPMVLTLPGGDVMRLPEITYGGRVHARARVMLAAATRAAAVLTVPSETMRDHAAAVGIDAVRLPFGVALDRWPPGAPRPRDPSRQFRLIHVASLNRVKDQETLLASAALLAQAGLAFELDIIGEDTLGGEVQARATALGLDHAVHFHGFLPHAEVRPWIDCADLMVITSLSEGGPIAMLEAAVAGVPTVGTAVGHVLEYASDAAIAMPIGDAGALASAIRSLAEDEPRRLSLATEAQRRAVAEDADHMTAAFLSLYDQVRLRKRRAA